MTVEKISIDTNILIYAMDRDAGKRHKMALNVIEKALTCDCLLPLQVLAEFFNVLTRKNQIPVQTAYKHVEDLMELFPVISAKEKTLKQAMVATKEHSLSFWDAMLWATVHDAGVTILLSEDFQHERTIKKTKIINPFLTNKYWDITGF